MGIVHVKNKFFSVLLALVFLASCFRGDVGAPAENNCTLNKACNAPAICWNGSCQALPCSNDESCSGSLTCQSSFCAPIYCSSDDGCPNEWHCESVGECVCVPSCNGKVCGDDGCGGSCGTCSNGAECATGGECVAACVPECTDKECGPDGCDGECGRCTASGYCTAYGTCACDPECDEAWECGGNGCGGDCGSCPQAAPICNTSEHRCVSECTPDCAGKECGDDGCGEECGTCPGAAPVCNAVTQLCELACTPACDGKVCGPDGCGGECGDGCSEEPNIACDNDTGQCVCTPQCTEGQECGDGGCGVENECGTCTAGNTCDEEGECVCVPQCTEGQECGDDGCDDECGDGCESDEVCANDVCVGVECVDLDGCENGFNCLGEACVAASASCAELKSSHGPNDGVYWLSQETGDPHWTNTKLLLQSEIVDGGAATTFVDSSSNHTLSVPIYSPSNDVHHNTAEAKFGTSSIHFDGARDQLHIDYHSDFDIGSADFTIEAWIKTTDPHTPAGHGIFSKTQYANTNLFSGYTFYIWSGKLVFMMGQSGGDTMDATHYLSLNGTTDVVDGQWHHVAVTREGNDWKLFVDGSIDGPLTQIELNNGTLVPNSYLGGGTVALSEVSNTFALTIGTIYNTPETFGGNLEGYLEEIRFTKGVARYTANFTPPTEPFSTDTQEIDDPILVYCDMSTDGGGWTLFANIVSGGFSYQDTATNTPGTNSLTENVLAAKPANTSARLRIVGTNFSFDLKSSEADGAFDPSISGWQPITFDELISQDNASIVLTTTEFTFDATPDDYCDTTHIVYIAGGHGSTIAGYTYESTSYCQGSGNTINLGVHMVPTQGAACYGYNVKNSLLLGEHFECNNNSPAGVPAATQVQLFYR